MTKFLLQLMQPVEAADAKIWYYGGSFFMGTHAETRLVDCSINAVSFSSKKEAEIELASINIPALTIVKKEIVYN